MTYLNTAQHDMISHNMERVTRRMKSAYDVFIGNDNHDNNNYNYGNDDEDTNNDNANDRY
jgi:hypothetical protein